MRKRQLTANHGRRLCWILASAMSLTFVSTASAQSFPTDDSRWEPITWNEVYLAEPSDDAPNDRLQEAQRGQAWELVGDLMTPGAYIASDDDYFYFRLRVDENILNPNFMGTDDEYPLKRFAWGVAIDVDNDTDEFEFVTVLTKHTECAATDGSGCTEENELLSG